MVYGVYEERKTVRITVVVRRIMFDLALPGFTRFAVTESVVYWLRLLPYIFFWGLGSVFYAHRLSSNFAILAQSAFCTMYCLKVLRNNENARRARVSNPRPTPLRFNVELLGPPGYIRRYFSQRFDCSELWDSREGSLHYRPASASGE